MQFERLQKSVNAQRGRAFVLLGFGLLLPVACAQGVQDTSDNVDPSGGTGGGTVGSSAGKSSGGAGKANGGAGQGNGTAGSAMGGGGAKGAAGAGTGGALGGASSGGAGGKANAGAGGATGGTSGSASTAGGGAGGSMAGAANGTAGSSSVAGFSVQYKNLNGSATDAYISCEILAKNSGPNSLQVSELKVRYYFTDEPKKTNTFQNNFQHLNVPGNQADLKVTQTVVGMAPTKPTADTYIEFSFSSSHGTLAPGEALDFAWQMQSANPATDNFTESNDYSFDASKSALTDWTHVVLLQGSSPLWGATP